MSPLNSSDEKESLSTSKSPGKSSISEDLASTGTQPSIVDSLGEALAGVSLVAQASNFGSSALVGASLSSGSSNHHHDGWGTFADTSAHPSSVFPSSGGMTASHGNKHSSNESLHRFLSQDPSQTLGEDVFRLSHPNLPSLNYEETKHDSTGSFRYPGQPLGLTSKHSFADMRPAVETRRHSESPSGTGTTASSRSASPYNNSDVGNAGRTIPSYQRYDAIAESAPAFNRNHTSFGDDERSNAGYISLNHSQSSNGLDSRSPYGKDRNNFIKPYEQVVAPVSQQADPMQQQQQQQQVLYMAVPSPDGRGQVLQPVQMVQLPGKPYTYVVPPPASAAVPQGPGYFQPDIPQSMMVLPPLNNGGMSDYGNAGIDLRLQTGVRPNIYGSDSIRLNGNDLPPPPDDFGRVANAVIPFQLDPTLPGGFGGSPQRPPLDALLGQIRRLSRDQVGCRLVQQALDEEGSVAATLILNEGLAFWGEAMVDPFGNYLFQKILEKVTAEERIMLVKSVSTRLVNASLNLHGTRSVQKVVELCAQDEQNLPPGVNPDESAASILTNALAPAAARLCIDSHGNHVIQRILLKLGPKHSKFVFDAVAASVGDVARHRHGCCVIQRCLDSPPNEARAHLVGRIVEKSLELMQDAYGNYVVQYVLDVCSDEDVHAVCESVVGRVNLLAIQKFSSNVMEKCLERCSDRVKEMYLAEMSDPERIRELMMDPFGNYVVQRGLSVATHAQAVRLVEAMRPHLIASQTSNGQRNGGVRNTAGGRRIIAKICRRFPNFTLNPVGTQDELYSQNKGVQRHHHHHQQQPSPVIQNFAVGPASNHLYASEGHHFVADPRMQQAPIQPQQPFYGLGGTTGYYDHFSSGGYTGM